MKKIGTKVVISVSIIIILLVTTIVSSSFLQLKQITQTTLLEECQIVVNTLKQNIDNINTDLGVIATSFSNDSNIRTGISNGNVSLLQSVFDSTKKADGVFAVFVDKEGKIVWQSDNSPKAFDVKEALEGKASVDIFTDEKVKLSFQYKMPVGDSLDKIGAVIVGQDMSNYTTVDSIKKQTGSDVTIFAGDTRIMTSVRNDKGQRAVGTKAETKVTDAVLKKGQNYNGNAVVVGTKMRTIYEPLKDKSGKIIGMIFAGQPTNKMDAKFNVAMIIVLSISFVLSVIALFVLVILSKRLISNPIKKIKDTAVSLENGNLQCEPIINNKADELGVLSRTMNSTVNQLNSYITDISNVLEAISNGDFTANSQIEYNGDFIEIKDSIKKITSTLSSMMRHINETSEQVYSNAEQISSGAQLLANGATEQASSIQELSATISNISNDVSNNANNVNTAREFVEQTVSDINNSTKEMKKMLEAMEAISRSSDQISSINKAIEDIAFQTNILALNAAVEAARAGTAGKGFAVVAEEVRNLASKSAQASQQASALIQTSIDSVTEGSKIAEDNAIALDKVAEKSLTVKNIIEKVNSASASQAAALMQINQGIELISSVIQTNSATAEQSAASSEQLFGKAQYLKKEVSKYKIQ